MRGERGAVDAQRRLLHPGFVHELQVKALWNGKIHLVCGKGELAPDG